MLIKIGSVICCNLKDVLDLEFLKDEISSRQIEELSYKTDLYQVKDYLDENTDLEVELI